MFSFLFKRHKTEESKVEFLPDDGETLSTEDPSDIVRFIINDNDLPLHCPKCDKEFTRSQCAGPGEAIVFKNKTVTRMKVKYRCPYCNMPSEHYFKFDEVKVTKLTNIMTGQKYEIDD